jgi:hypothetical protein
MKLEDALELRKESIAAVEKAMKKEEAARDLEYRERIVAGFMKERPEIVAIDEFAFLPGIIKAQKALRFVLFKLDDAHLFSANATGSCNLVENICCDCGRYELSGIWGNTDGELLDIVMDENRQTGHTQCQSCENKSLIDHAEQDTPRTQDPITRLRDVLLDILPELQRE